MNDAPMKKPDARTTATQPTELSEPHFDEMAVFIAQPVEPIEPRVNRRWLAQLERPRTLLAIVFISVMLGIAALALTLQLHAQTQGDTAATEIPAEQPTPEKKSSTAETESQLAADIAAQNEEQKAHPRRTRTSKAGPRVEDNDSRPKARRVGVIYYGSSNRP